MISKISSQRCVAILLAACVLMRPVAAAAHVSIEPSTAGAGSVKLTFAIPHGCAGSATTVVRIKIPEGFIGVKPAPKSGWTLATRTDAYARSYDYFHGKTLSRGVTEVVWSGGKLQDDHFDEFKVMGFVTGGFQPGDAIYFPVTQACEEGQLVWSEVPAAGADPHSLKSPAPALRIVAARDARVADDASKASEVVKAGTLVVRDAFARATPDGVDIAAAYMKIENSGDQADTLLSVTFANAGATEIHQTLKDGDVSRMRAVPEGIVIPGKSPVTLEPGGLHVMLRNLRAPLREGERVDAVLQFRNGGAVPVRFEVRDAGASANGGHNHH